MTLQQLAARWHQQQIQALLAAYARAWQQGASAFRSQSATPLYTTVTQQPQSSAPQGPDRQRMGQALGPALASAATMAAEIAALTPITVERMALPAQIAAAIAQYLAANLFRVKQGSYVAWAGEQAGYAETANSAGLLLKWQLEPGAHHCVDCPALSALPAMALNQWPTLPGMGATACGVGCHCSLVAAGTAPQPLQPLQVQAVQKVAARAHDLVTV